MVSQWGGHAVPRTHKPSGHLPVGYTFITTLIAKLHENKDKGCTFTETEAKAIIGNSKAVSGVIVEMKGGITIRCRSSAVVIASGGFANDHTKDSLLKEFVPQYENYPTTNGPFAQGKGFKIARKLGAAYIDMDLVQIHPTGFINPKDRNNKSKFLGPELLRGIGGILLNEHGKRFCNELGLRDYVSEEIMKNCKDSIAFMILGGRSSELFGVNYDFYVAKGFIRKFDTLKELCEIGRASCRERV